MAHQLGGLYDLPHGVCIAMLLPYVEEENAKKAPTKFRLIATAIVGMDTAGKSDEEYVDFIISKIKALSAEVGIRKSLKEVALNNPDFEKFAEFVMKDACAGQPDTFLKKGARCGQEK